MGTTTILVGTGHVEVRSLGSGCAFPLMRQLGRNSANEFTIIGMLTSPEDEQLNAKYIPEPSAWQSEKELRPRRSCTSWACRLSPS